MKSKRVLKVIGTLAVLAWLGWTLTGCVGITLPIAAFTANPTAGVKDLVVQFTDQSTGNISDWLWDFGDGATSTEQHPTHTYTAAGIYDVSLTVRYGGLTPSTETKPDYIKVGNTGVGVPGATHTTIGGAVGAAPPGGIIVVGSGTYAESFTINQALTLVAGSKPIIQGTITVNADNVTINGFIIEDDAAGSLLYGIDIKGGSSYITISDCEIRSFNEKDDAGIAGWMNAGDPDFAAIDHVTIENNDLHDNWDGINIGAMAWPNPPAWRHNNITIEHNEVYDNHYRGINLWSVSDSTVANNAIRDNGGDYNANGVFDEAGDDFNGNSVPDGDGMTWAYVSNSTANNNKINGNREVGLSLNQSTVNTVTGNDVTSNKNIGIGLYGWGAPTTGNTFTNNDARNNVSWDIQCYTKWGSQVFGNTWIGNLYDDADPTPPV